MSADRGIKKPLPGLGEGYSSVLDLAVSDRQRHDPPHAGQEVQRQGMQVDRTSMRFGILAGQEPARKTEISTRPAVYRGADVRPPARR